MFHDFCGNLSCFFISSYIDVVVWLTVKRNPFHRFFYDIGHSEKRTFSTSETCIGYFVGSIENTGHISSSSNSFKGQRKTFEFKKTIKKSLETFGEPVKLYYKRPQIKKTRLVCITDVSESVKLHVKLILQLIYELSSVFKSGVRSFMFVGNLYEVTDTLNEFPIVEAIDLACEQAPMEYSNYNEAFGLFVKNHIGIIDKNTIVIIFGDARNNRYDDGVQYLKQIKKKAKTIVWLNPEVKSKWNTGDSIMGKYKPMVNAVYQVNTFNELVGFIDQFAV